VLFGLSAIGIVAIVRTVQKRVKRWISPEARIAKNAAPPDTAPTDLAS